MEPYKSQIPEALQERLAQINMRCADVSCFDTMSQDDLARWWITRLGWNPFKHLASFVVDRFILAPRLSAPAEEQRELLWKIRKWFPLLRGSTDPLLVWIYCEVQETR